MSFGTTHFISESLCCTRFQVLAKGVVVTALESQLNQAGVLRWGPHKTKQNKNAQKRVDTTIPA